MPHAIAKLRYQFVKTTAELAWVDRWIHGQPGWINWDKVLDKLPPDVRSSAP